MADDCRLVTSKLLRLHEYFLSNENLTNLFSRRRGAPFRFVLRNPQPSHALVAAIALEPDARYDWHSYAHALGLMQRMNSALCPTSA
jgi:hypothetical protein